MNIQYNNKINKTNLYYVQNGIGKVALFTNFINDLYERDQNKISISSPYPEIFKNHPYVQSSTMLGTESSKMLDDYFDDMIYVEPYFSVYNKDKSHILKVWRELLGVNSETFDDYIEIFTDNESNLYYQKVQESIGKPYIIIQFKGGTNIYSKEKNIDTSRDYNDELNLITKIHNTFKEYFIMVIKTQHDYYNPLINNLDRICTVEDENILILQELVNNCTTFVSIDSCIQHLACNKNYFKRGVVLWGNSTHSHKIGHQMHINLKSDSLMELKINHDDVIDNLKNLLEYV